MKEKEEEKMIKKKKKKMREEGKKIHRLNIRNCLDYSRFQEAHLAQM